MTRQLVVHGTLADNGIAARLHKNDLGLTDVLEAESLLPPEQRAPVGSWTNALELCSPEDLVQSDQSLNELLSYYLDTFSVSSHGRGKIPLTRTFRAACLGMTCRKWISPYLVNLELARRMFERAAFDKIVVAPGAGISFRAWRQVAQTHGIPITFLEKEPRPWSLKRRWQRLVNRWRKRPVTVVPLPPETLGETRVEVLCTSIRLARMLHQKTSPGNAQKLDWAYVSDDTLGQPGPGQMEELKAGYARWWQECEARLDELVKADPAEPRSILRDLGRQQSREVYPRFAWKYLRAKEHLARLRPKLLLCDTQEGSDERAWSLAASELGIPVAAYTYDHIPQPRFSFSPDWLLCDSGRNAHIAKIRGHRPERIVRVESHRRPPPPLEGAKPPAGNVILYADSYYSGTSATVEPQRSYKHYQLIVETARRMPGCQFLIKFHPLRDRKREEQCFIGMDEDELYVRTRYIRELRPPSNVKLVPPEESMMDWIPKASVLLNSNSTAGLEAFVLGVPVIFLYQPNTELGFPLLWDYEACIVAEEPQNLEGEINRLQTDGAHATRHIHNQRRYVDEFYWSSGEQSLIEGIQSVLKMEEKASHAASTGMSEAGP